MKAKKNVLVFLIVTAIMQWAGLALAEGGKDLPRGGDHDEPMKTLLSGGNVNGGGGGPLFKYSKLIGESIWMIGGRGGAIVSNNLELGGVVLTSTEVAKKVGSDKVKVSLFSTGVYGGYHFFPKSVIHPYIGASVGAIYVTEETSAKGLPLARDGEETSNFGVSVEPEAQLVVNLAKNIRFSLAASYRSVTGLRDMQLAHEANVSSRTYAAQVSFGSF